MPPHQGHRFLTGVPFDFSRHNDQPIIHSKIVTLKKKPIEVVVTELKVTSRSVARLAECLIEEYSKTMAVGEYGLQKSARRIFFDPN